VGRKFGFSFSWKRALGLSAAKGKLSRLIGIPLTKSGRQRKAGRLLGDLVDTALIAGIKTKSAQSTLPTHLPPVAPSVIAPNRDDRKPHSEDLALYGKSLMLATQKPKGWEYLLFAQVIIDEGERAKHALPQACEPNNLSASTICSVDDFSDWATARLEEMNLLSSQISELSITNDNAAFGLPGQPGSVPAIVSLSLQIGLVCQRCLEWSQNISNAPLHPLFREAAQELHAFTYAFIDSTERFANKFMQQVQDALSKPPGSQVVIDACLKIDQPDLTRFHAAMTTLKSQMEIMANVQALSSASSGQSFTVGSTQDSQVVASTAGSPELGPRVIDANHLVDYRHGAKILVQYIPSGNETTVYHDIPNYDSEYKGLPFKPDLNVNGQIINGKHTFGFHNSLKFSGRKPTAIPIDASCWWIHKIADPNEWRYPPNSRVILSADSDQFEIDVYSQTELRRDHPSDAEFNEVLITTPTYEMYVKLASAKNVTIQIGKASFSLSPEIIASYRDFIGYLTPGS
jgi:hypothetical protein